MAAGRAVDHMVPRRSVVRKAGAAEMDPHLITDELLMLHHIRKSKFITD